jgi:hypothetical protein
VGEFQNEMVIHLLDPAKLFYEFTREYSEIILPGINLGNLLAGYIGHSSFSFGSKTAILKI